MGPDNGLTYPGHWMAGNTPVVSQLPRLIQTPGLGMQAKGGYLLKETQDGSFWRRWWASPFFDEMTLDAAEMLIRNEHLGEGQTTDLLALGLSATNALEHAYGNSGPEMLDQIRRLDRRLGMFLDRIQAGGRSVATDTNDLMHKVAKVVTPPFRGQSSGTFDLLVTRTASLSVGPFTTQNDIAILFRSDTRSHCPGTATSAASFSGASR
jgi:hypothetical protein